MHYRHLTLLAVLAVHGSAGATLRDVPAQYPTIRAAILAANPLDTVLVAPGTYTENINFYGKRIVVASHYVLDGNPLTIRATVIDGSQPQFADSGSVVAFISGEDSAAELAGFTITGGTGMPLEDDDNHNIYVEGGGVMIENSSPYVHHNLIIGNDASRRPAGVVSAGGGGIRCGFSSGTRLHNNVIIGNHGRYGGGVVINYAIAELRNNIIALNTGGQDYGGGGLWTNGTQTDTCFLWNNTIVGNSSALPGGGIRRYSQRIYGGNNIVYGNRAATGAAQIQGSGAALVMTYSCVQGGYAGEGNINVDPGFADSLLRLVDDSPCVDTGHPDAAYNDPNSTRADIGAYGGPLATDLSFASAPLIRTPEPFTRTAYSLGSVDTFGVAVFNDGLGTLRIENAYFAAGESNGLRVINEPLQIRPVVADSLFIRWQAIRPTDILDTLLIFHNDSTVANPLRVPFQGFASEAAESNPVHESPAGIRFDQNYPNPFNPTTELRFVLPHDEYVTLRIYDATGRALSTPAAGRLSAGAHRITWDAGGLPSGTYFARLSATTYSVTRKLQLLK